MNAMNDKWYSGMARTEDWWAVWLGLIMFMASVSSLWGLELTGWMAKPETWVWEKFSMASGIIVTGDLSGIYRPDLSGSMVDEI